MRGKDSGIRQADKKEGERATPDTLKPCKRVTTRHADALGDIWSESAEQSSPLESESGNGREGVARLKRGQQLGLWPVVTIYSEVLPNISQVAGEGRTHPQESSQPLTDLNRTDLSQVW